MTDIVDGELLITIAIPTKNSAETVGYTMASIYRQMNTIPRNCLIELVIVDGCSIDNTVRIVNEWIDKIKARHGDKLLRHEILYEKVGVGFARQLALNWAQGKWILWVDSDNVLSENYITKAIEALKKNAKTNTAVLYPAVVKPLYVHATLAKKLILCYDLTGQSYIPIASQRFKYISKRSEDISIQGSLPYPAMQGTLCSTEALRDVGGFDLRLTMAAEDIDLFLRLIERGYEMKPFNATLYHFVRSSLKSWFKEAVAWDYGKQFVLNKLSEHFYTKSQKVHPFVRLVKRALEESITLLIKSLCYLKSVKTCGSYGLLMPLLYMYRRAGYITGTLRAWSRFKQC